MSEAQSELTYTLSTDESSARLGLSSRHVRRMAQTGLLKAQQQSTPHGKQWFFNEDDVENVRSIRARMAAKEERHEVAKETFGHVAEDDRGQPRTSEDMSADVLTRASFIQKMLEDERAAHEETQKKLDQSQTELREEGKKASRLEGEKEGFQAGYQKVIDEQQKFITMLAGKLQLQAPPTSDVAEDDRGQPRTSVEVSEAVSVPAEPGPSTHDATPMTEPPRHAPYEPPVTAFEILDTDGEELPSEAA